MHDLWISSDLMPTLFALAVAAGFPPIASGAFWAVTGFWGIVSVLFDDETPRGVPGIEYLHSSRHTGASGDLS